MYKQYSNSPRIQDAVEVAVINAGDPDTGSTYSDGRYTLILTDSVFLRADMTVSIYCMVHMIFKLI